MRKVFKRKKKFSPSNPDYVSINGIKDGYLLGAFRNYDHDWKVYIFKGCNSNR